MPTLKTPTKKQREADAQATLRDFKYPQTRLP